MFTMSLLLIYYLNFKYGNTQSPELGDSVPREVRDRDYFYLWSFSAWGVWAGLGLVFLWETLAALVGSEDTKLGGRTLSLPRRQSWLVASPILALALIPLVNNIDDASRRGHTYTRDFAYDLLNSDEPYGVLVTVGDNDTFPLWYAQEVEGIRKDVVVANTSLLNTDWYVRQLIRRPVFEYDEAKGPAIYRGRRWAKPSGPPLRLTLDQADSIPPYTVLGQPMSFRKGDLVATIDPRGLSVQDPNGGGGLLQRADIAVLRMIADAWPERPIYFSRTSGGYARELGLGDRVLTQGLASKLWVPPTAAAALKDTMYVQGDGWIDIPRTRTLWTDVFQGPQSIVRKSGWPDRPSVGIPYLYVATGLSLSESLRAQGQTALAQQVYDRAKQVANAVRLGDIFASMEASQPPQLIPGAPGDSRAGQEVPAGKAP
jgi:hypothetical protein